MLIYEFSCSMITFVSFFIIIIIIIIISYW